VNLLILGGSLFLGRHVAESAMSRGHAVSAFTRGRRALPQGVLPLIGDRDPRNAQGLAALEGGRFDAVVDCTGYVPRVVEASSSLLAKYAERCIFVSTVSVYADVSRPGIAEDAPLARLDDPATEDVPKHYGALKAACEDVVRRGFGERATIVRPGLIVGPHDPTDRFGYWPARFVHPGLLGDRPASAVVPAPRERPIQVIDARDLASFIVDLAERDAGGVYNAISPARQWTFGDLVDACVDVATDRPGNVAPPSPTWVDEATLLRFHVEPWTGLPLWIPASDADAAGFDLIDTSAANAQGLRTRALHETVRDTAAWLASRDNALAWKNVLSDARERQILSDRASLGAP
jgi:2'-hydroxyisoflavone reductase